MISLTERYLEAALRDIPESQRADVERELRSSITDAVEDRVAAGEPREAAEKAVLEGLGEPSRLAASYSGRRLYLIGPELYPVWRHFLIMLARVAIPAVAVVQTVVGLMSGAEYLDALLTGIGAALSVGIGVAFWTTLVFALIERATVLREARTEIIGATSRWSVDQLPEPAVERISLADSVGEIVTLLIAIGGLLFLRDTSWFGGADAGVEILDPGLSAFWLPYLISLLGVLILLRIAVYFSGRWTLHLATIHAVVQVAYAGPLIWLALTGSLVNPAFAAEIGAPDLAAGDGPTMVIVAVAVFIAVSWQVFDGFRHARQSVVGGSTRSPRSRPEARA